MGSAAGRGKALQNRESPTSISKVRIGFLPLDQRHFCLFPCKVSVISLWEEWSAAWGFVWGEARAPLRHPCCSLPFSGCLLSHLFVFVCCGRRCLLNIPVLCMVTAWHSLQVWGSQQSYSFGTSPARGFSGRSGAGTFQSCRESCDSLQQPKLAALAPFLLIRFACKLL